MACHVRQSTYQSGALLRKGLTVDSSSRALAPLHGGFRQGPPPLCIPQSLLPHLECQMHSRLVTARLTMLQCHPYDMAAVLRPISNQEQEQHL